MLRTKGKVFTCVLLLLGLFYAFSLSVSAAEPRYNNTTAVYTTFNISSEGQAVVSIALYAGSNMTSAKITTCIQKKVLGLFWVKVDNGQNNDEWIAYTSRSFSTSYYLQLPEKGEYRVMVNYIVSGTGGADDNIPETIYKNWA